MKKLFTVVGAFLIFYFSVVAFKSAVELGRFISLGRIEIEYGFYILLIVLLILFAVIPLLRYLSIPHLKRVHQLLQRPKLPKSVIKHFLKSADTEELIIFSKIDQSDTESQIQWIRNCLEKDVKKFDGIIGRYAKKTTISVMISPNSFIDGMIILLSNINMISELGKVLRVRIGLKDSAVLLLKVMSFSSVIGLYEEFDEVIEEAIEEVIEEFADVFMQDAPNDIIGSIPGLSILPKFISPLLQGAANFSFVYYIGFAYKNYIKAAIGSSDKIDEEEIKRSARKEARKMKRVFMGNAIKELSIQSAHRTGKVFTSFLDFLKNWNANEEVSEAEGFVSTEEPFEAQMKKKWSLFRK